MSEEYARRREYSLHSPDAPLEKYQVPEESQRYEQVTLHSPGGIPGIPGSHGPGTYMIDRQERKVYTLQEWEDMQVKPVVEEKPTKQARASKDVL